MRVSISVSVYVHLDTRVCIFVCVCVRECYHWILTMANYQIALNAWSVHYTNWTINKIPFRWMVTKQCLVGDSIPFNEIVSNPAISQNTMLANGQYIFSMVILLMILLLFRRATTSITKDVDSIAYLCKDLIALLKLLHWKHCDYSNCVFNVCCFLIFIAVLPLLLTIWLCMLCYRHYIHYMIKVSSHSVYLLNVICFSFLFFCDFRFTKIYVLWLCSKFSSLISYWNEQCHFAFEFVEKIWW